MNNQQILTSSIKVFRVLDVLTQNFAVGFSNNDIAQGLDLPPATVTLCLNTLIAAGYAEVIEETGRYRPSHRFAQKAATILRSLDNAVGKFEASKFRINTEI